MNALAAAAYAEFAVQSNFSFLRGASKPEELVGHGRAARALRQSALPTATRWPASCAPGSRRRSASIAYHPGCRLVFCRRHARHAGLSAGPQGLGPSLPHADAGQSCGRKREGRAAFSIAAIFSNGATSCRSPSCRILTAIRPRTGWSSCAGAEGPLSARRSGSPFRRLWRQRPLPAGAGGGNGRGGRRCR